MVNSNIFSSGLKRKKKKKISRITRPPISEQILSITGSLVDKKMQIEHDRHLLSSTNPNNKKEYYSNVVFGLSSCEGIY